MRKIFLKLVLSLLLITEAYASDDQLKPKEYSWSFDGVFGYFDKQSIQRGFKVYKEVCATCHSLDLLSFRNLQEVGLNKDEVKSLASTYEIVDGPNDTGEMFTRPGKLFDKFPAPYKNDQEARAANNGALPPDLSLVVKAREDGANYIMSLLTGYNHPIPKKFHLQEGMYYNPYFPGKQIAMPAPLSEGLITYDDGKDANIEQMSKDIVNFLQWAAEPEMESRKLMGIKVMLYLFVFVIVFYLAKKRIWARVK